MLTPDQSTTEAEVDYMLTEGAKLEAAELVFAMSSASAFTMALSLMCLTTRAILRIDRSPAYGEQTIHSHMIALNFDGKTTQWHYDLCEGAGWQSLAETYEPLRDVLLGAIRIVFYLPTLIDTPKQTPKKQTK